MSSRFLYIFNDRRHFRRFLWGLVGLTIVIGLGGIIVPAAYAQVFSCTGPSPNGNMFQYDSISTTIHDKTGATVTINTATTQTNNLDPFNTTTGGACSMQDVASGSTSQLGVVGQVLCFFKSTIGQIVSQMYCGFQDTLKVPLSIAITLFVAITGLFVMTGMVRLTVREAMVAIFKIALVWAFATNAEFGIGIAYAFFMGLAEQGVALVMSAATSGGSGTIGTALTNSDSLLTDMLNFTSQGSRTGIFTATYASVPTECMIWLFTFAMLIFILVPPLALAIFGLILQYMWLYGRALLGYLTALVLIGFLFVLSPLFICFLLFQITRPLFEQWLKYLTSFSLQMIIVFGFMGILSMVPLGDFFSEILHLLRKYDLTQRHNLMPLPMTSCSVCEYLINPTGSLTDPIPPITCANNNAIPYSQLFASQDLIQAIVSQCIALSIVGYIMQDFLHRAPDIARDLAGRLPFAATLGGGGGATPFSEGPSVQYPGLDALEQYTTGLANSPTMRSMSAKGMLARGTLAAGLMASTGAGRDLLNRLRANTDPNSKANATSGSNTGSTADLKSGNVQQSAAKNDGRMAGAAGGVYIAPNDDNDDNAGGNTMMTRTAYDALAPALGYEAAKLDYAMSNERLDKEYTNVYSALAEVQRLKEQNIQDAVAMKRALGNLKEADDNYLVSWRDRNVTQTAMLRAGNALTPELPQDKSIKLQDYMSQGSTAKTSNDNNSPAVSSTEMRTVIDQTIQHLQLQISVQQYLLPDDRVKYANDSLNQALSNLQHAQSDQSLQDVMKQLYVVEKSLS